MEGWTDGPTDRLMDGWTDRWTAAFEHPTQSHMITIKKGTVCHKGLFDFYRAVINMQNCFNVFKQFLNIFVYINGNIKR